MCDMTHVYQAIFVLVTRMSCFGLGTAEHICVGGVWGNDEWA
jgi:hypothetical protein